MKDLSPIKFRGWKGFISYFKSFSASYRKREAEKHREEKLLLYYSIQRLIRESCASFGIKESKKSEFRFYFHEAKSLTVIRDIDYFLNSMNHIKSRLESGEYPPFPRFFPSILSRTLYRDQLYYRKYI